MLERLTETVLDHQDLTEEEAEEALKAVLDEASRDEEIERFLVSLAQKGAGVAEVTGFARGMRELAVSIDTEHEVFVDTAGTGGGAATFNISTAAALVIAAAGIPVAKHGNRAITSKSGSADVLRALGVNLDRPVAVSEKALNEIGLCFMFAPHFHPAMKRVAEIRRRLGRRTIFNLLGPLTNPAGAPFQVIGVYDQSLTEMLAQALLRLGTERAWVVHGNDGLDEVTISDATQVSRVKDGEVTTFEFNPLETRLGIPKGGSPQENAVLIRGILDGTVTGPAKDVVVLNAAVALHVATTDPMTRCLRRSEEAVEDGAALAKLEQLKEAYGESRG